MEKTIRVRRSFWYDKKPVAVGAVLTIPAPLAAGFVSMNKAEYVPEPEETPKKEELVIESMQIRDQAPQAEADLAPQPDQEKSKKGGYRK